MTAVATPSRTSDTNPNTCSRTKIMIAITPTAKKPGVSRTVCSNPMSEPSKLATSITKLFNKADHVLKAIGMAKAIRNNNTIGRRQRGSFCASASVTVFNMLLTYAQTLRREIEEWSVLRRCLKLRKDKRVSRSSVDQYRLLASDRPLV